MCMHEKEWEKERERCNWVGVHTPHTVYICKSKDKFLSFYLHMDSKYQYQAVRLAWQELFSYSKFEASLSYVKSISEVHTYSGGAILACNRDAPSFSGSSGAVEMRPWPSSGSLALHHTTVCSVELVDLLQKLKPQQQGTPHPPPPLLLQQRTWEQRKNLRSPMITWTLIFLIKPLWLMCSTKHWSCFRKEVLHLVSFPVSKMMEQTKPT